MATKDPLLEDAVSAPPVETIAPAAVDPAAPVEAPFDLESGYRQRVEEREADATIEEFDARMRPQAEADARAAAPKPTATPADAPLDERGVARKVFERLTGLDGQDRYQLWPERMVRSAATLAGDVASGKEPLTLPSVSDDPARADFVGNADAFGTVPNPKIIERAQDLSGAMVTGAIPGVVPRGALGTAGSRMAPAEKDLVSKFVGDDPYANSLTVNPVLREGKPLTPEAEQLVAALDKAFAEAPRLETEMTVYRAQPKGAATGTDPAFISTSRDKAVAEEFAFNLPDGGEVVAIKLAPGTPILDTAPFQMEGMRYQQEILLPRDGTLRRVGEGELRYIPPQTKPVEAPAPLTPQLASTAKAEGFPLFQAGVPVPAPANETPEDFAKRMAAGGAAGTNDVTAAPAPLPKAVTELTPSYAAQAVSMAGATVKDIGKGVFKEMPRAVLRGVLKAADNTAGALNEFGDWLDQNVADLSFNVPSSGNATVDAVGGAVLNPVDAIKSGLEAAVGYISKPESVTGKMIESTAQFLAGFIPALSASRALGLGSVAAPVVAGGASAFLTTTPEEGNVAKLLREWPGLTDPVTKYLATDPESPEGLNRVRHAVEGLGFGVLTEGIVRGLRFAANSRRASQSVKALRDADEAAGAVIARELDSMGGGADQPLVLVKGKAAGPSVPAGDNVPGRAASALGRSAQETTTGVPDHVVATAIKKDVESGLVPLVENTGDGAAAVSSATGRSAIYINLGRVETADDVKVMMQQVADAMAPEITAAKRGVQTLDETGRLADRLGLTAEELVARPRGSAMNSEQIVAANRILTTSSENLWGLVQKAASPTATPIDGYNFRRAYAVHNAIQQSVLGANAEAGRALSALRIARSSSGAAMNREISAMMDQLGGQAVTAELAQNMLAMRAQGLADGAIDAATRRGWLATTQSVARESYALGQLWNPKTHIRNLSSNMIVAFQQGYERYAAGKIGQLLATPVEEAVLPNEALAYMYGQVSSIKDALRIAGRTFVDPTTAGVMGKVDVQQGAISSSTLSRELSHSPAEAAKFAETAMGRFVDFAGEVTRAPGRALGAGDSLYKTVAYSAEVRTQALRKATQEGHSGKDLADRVADLVANPPEFIKASAVDHALYATFNNEPGKIAQALLTVRNYDGVVNPTFMIAPYLRTPANILRYTANRTPLAALSRQWYDDIAAGGARRDIALARMSTGTAVMAAALDYASSGVITGAGPADATKRDALMNTGWRPYSIKIGDKYISYAGTDPLTQPLAFAASVAEMVKASDLSPEDFDAVEEMLAQSIGVVARNVVDKSYFQGIAGFFNALEDSGSKPGAMASWMVRQVSGIVPLASVGRMVNDIMGTTRREPANLMEGVMSQIPGLAAKLIPARNVWGAEVKPQEVFGRFYDIASPFYVSRETGSTVDNELVRLNTGVQRIPWKASFAGTQVNFHDYSKVLDEYRVLAGNELKHPAWGLGAKDFLDQVISGRHALSQVYAIYSDGPDGGKAAFIKNTVSEYRKLAQQQILAEAEDKYPGFFQYVTGKQVQKQELQMPVTEGAPAR